MSVKCMDFLAKPPKNDPPPVVVVFGDEDFLRREASAVVRTWVVGEDPDAFTCSEYNGADVQLATVLDELSTPPFLGDRRIVIVEDAAPFITAHRASLEKYVDKPSSSGVLLLETTTWPSNTKLAKAVEATGLSIDATAPKPWLVAKWCSKWAKDRYQKTLDERSAEWLVELAGTGLGQLDQELSKLSSLVGDDPNIDAKSIDRVVAGTRTETVFRLFDMVIEGNLSKALELLERQFIAGESPVGILAMITSQLRRLAQAAQQADLGTPTQEALRNAGVPHFAIDKARAQLNHFGRQRMDGMYRRLLRADLDIKGGSGLSQRTVVERLLVELARPKGA